MAHPFVDHIAGNIHNDGDGAEGQLIGRDMFRAICGVLNDRLQLSPPIDESAYNGLPSPVNSGQE